MDYYETLGVGRNATDAEIKKAYRTLAHEHHPDKGGGAESAGKFKKINEAYQVLSDRQKRAQYDQFGHEGFRQSQQAGGGYSGFSAEGGPGSAWDFSGFSGFGGFGGGLNDIFENFFGQAFLTMQGEVEITPAQAVLGEKMSVRIGAETIELNIPAGIQDGSQFQFRGKGQQGRNGQRGDLIITIRIKTPKNVSAEQKELYQQIRDLEHRRRGFWNR